MRLCAEVRYCLSGAFHSTFSMYEPFVMALAHEYDLDIDGIADESSERRLFLDDVVKKITDRIFKSSNPMVKTKIMYKTIHESKYMFDMVIDKIYKVLHEYCFLNDTNSHNLPEEEIITLLDNTVLFPVYFNNNFTLDGSNINRMEFYYNFERIFKETFQMLKNNVNFTFKEIIKNEYIFQQKRYNNSLNQLINTQVSTYYHTDTSTYLDLSTLTSSTNIIQTINTSSTGNYLNNTIPTATWINHSGTPKIDLPIIKKKEKKKTKTKEYSVLKKSLKGINKFIDFKKINTILGDGLIVEGKQFNFKIKASKKQLLYYSKKLDNYSISYDLELLDKNNDQLCKICIVHKDCPILDEILIIYLMILTGKEDDIINIGNHFSRKELYYKYFKEEKKAATESTGLGPSDSLIRTIRNKDIIRSWVIGRFSKFIPQEILDYIFSLDVSWSEAISFANLEYFNVEIFDKYVKRIKWKPIKKFNILTNKILTEPKLLVSGI